MTKEIDYFELAKSGEWTTDNVEILELRDRFDKTVQQLLEKRTTKD